jgi:hypothetical protein
VEPLGDSENAIKQTLTCRTARLVVQALMAPEPHDSSPRHDHVLILDFGSQVTQLIARRVRESGVYCEVWPFHHAPEERIRAFAPRGIILSGGPASVTEGESPRAPDVVFTLGVPVIGICYGQQTLAAQLGGLVVFAALAVLLGQLGDQVRRFGLAVRGQAVDGEDGLCLGGAVGVLVGLDAVDLFDPLQPGADRHGGHHLPLGVDVDGAGVDVVACDAGVWMPLAHDFFDG